MNEDAAVAARATANLGMVTIDCPDPGRLAAFWASVLDGEVTHSDDAYAMVVAGTTTLGFGRVDDHVPPSWPDDGGRKQFHLDLQASDVDAVESACVAAGAVTPDHQPGGGRWRVLLDPAGHPFCLSPAAAW